MIIDGKKIAQEIKEKLKREVESLGRTPRLSIVYVGSDPAIESFIKIKKRFGEEIGVGVEVYRFEESIGQEELKGEIQTLAQGSDGVVVQLPLPKNLNTQEVLNLVPTEKDIDVLSEGVAQESRILSPVVGAIKEIFDRYDVDIKNGKIVVIGKGRLVGQPMIYWLKHEGIKPIVLKKGDDIEEELQDAGIIISGVGSPGIIKPEMLKEGVILIDAGTSESAGRIAGDADPACAEKSSIFTPVPGGIGPITVAVLFRNILDLIRAS